MTVNVHRYNGKLIDRARELRKNMTEEEALLWKEIRNKRIGGHKFLRQKPIGNYIVDFICKESKFVIEVDGGYHGTADQGEYDSFRDAYLKGLGLKVLHIMNVDIKNDIDRVLQEIREHLRV